MTNIIKKASKSNLKVIEPMTFDYKQSIQFENTRTVKILNLKLIREKIITRAQAEEFPARVVLGLALKLSVSGTNLSTMTPLVVGDFEYAIAAVQKLIDDRGSDQKEDVVTVSRYCAAFSEDISKYLDLHPKQIRLLVNNVPAKYSFPHCYYIPNLNEVAARQCIQWLKVFDTDMASRLPSWRSVATKAIRYLGKQNSALLTLLPEASLDVPSQNTQTMSTHQFYSDPRTHQMYSNYPNVVMPQMPFQSYPVGTYQTFSNLNPSSNSSVENSATISSDGNK